MHDTEDKDWWVIAGGKKEEQFVKEICPRICLDAQINPAKEKDKYAPDLLVEGKLADLKCQQTPFFRAWERYRIPHQFAVTFNHKDYLRYTAKYPNLVIYYWVDWKETKKKIGNTIYIVQSMSGVWRVGFPTLSAMIAGKKVDLHPYERRRNDTQGNAKESYVFDCREFEKLFYKGPDFTPIAIFKSV